MRTLSIFPACVTLAAHILPRGKSMIVQEYSLGSPEFASHLKTGHFILASKRHALSYFDKSGLYLFPAIISELCRNLVLLRADFDVDVVLGPVIGGVVISQWTAYHLGSLTNRKIVSVFAEKQGDLFELKRGFDKIVAGKKTLLVEDVLTTGGSIKTVASAARKHGADIVGAVALLNRGGVTAEQIGVPNLCSLVNQTLPSWTAVECPHCIAENARLDAKREKAESTAAE